MKVSVLDVGTPEWVETDKEQGDVFTLTCPECLSRMIVMMYSVKISPCACGREWRLRVTAHGTRIEEEEDD